MSGEEGRTQFPRPQVGGEEGASPFGGEEAVRLDRPGDLAPPIRSGGRTGEGAEGSSERGEDRSDLLRRRRAAEDDAEIAADGLGPS